MTCNLLALSDWLAAEGMTHVAMESTGVYWKPVFNLLEGRFQVWLVNARHIKQVPGRKTDVKDSQWIAQLMQHGLLRRSFIPPPPVRELRDLTRQRATLATDKATLANRLQKLLETANIKLASVATDVLGKSGRAMMEALIAGESDGVKLADLAQKRMRSKIPQLQLALQGRMTEHQRFLLRLLLDQVTNVESLMQRLEERIETVLGPFQEAVERLTTIPGVAATTAQAVVAEVGLDMKQFPSAAHMASWVGLCPGNNESAGHSRSGRTTKGNVWLRRVLVQAAWASTRAKKTYLAAQYHRLARRGKKRALIAVAHTLIVTIYHMLSRGSTYQELGADYFDRLAGDRLKRHLIKRLESLGHKVVLEPVQSAA
jgi:transposase